MHLGLVYMCTKRAMTQILRNFNANFVLQNLLTVLDYPIIWQFTLARNLSNVTSAVQTLDLIQHSQDMSRFCMLRRKTWSSNVSTVARNFLRE